MSIAMEQQAASTPPLNRYKNARRNPDFTIDQDWASYSAEEHDRWDRLFARSHDILQRRACAEFLHALDALELSKSGIPDLTKLSDRLRKITGWRVVPVTDLVPDALSAVYTFYDPDEVSRGLGTLAILKQLEWAARAGRSRLYLGYWIAGHDKMDYKRRFAPLEGFDGRGWRPLDFSF